MYKSQVKSINNTNFLFRPCGHSDTDNLVAYLDSLGEESRSRFEPHPFTADEITKLQNNYDYHLFIAVNLSNTFIAAYTIVKLGWLEYEKKRYTSYGLTESLRDCTIAPSVADYWQSKGVGSAFFEYVTMQIQQIQNIKRIFLWGGVQITNTKAISFYRKYRFKILGEFEYNGNNNDMMLSLTS
jgi:ribosomal protein S18 acetylase RimI-like enzyme